MLVGLDQTNHCANCRVELLAVSVLAEVLADRLRLMQVMNLAMVNHVGVLAAGVLHAVTDLATQLSSNSWSKPLTSCGPSKRYGQGLPR